MFLERKPKIIFYKNKKIKIILKRVLIIQISGLKGKLSYIIKFNNIYIVRKNYRFVFIMLRIWYINHKNLLKQVYGIGRKWKYSLYNKTFLFIKI